MASKKAWTTLNIDQPKQYTLFAVNGVAHGFGGLKEVPARAEKFLVNSVRIIRDAFYDADLSKLGNAGALRALHISLTEPKSRRLISPTTSKNPALIRGLAINLGIQARDRLEASKAAQNGDTTADPKYQGPPLSSLHDALINHICAILASVPASDDPDFTAAAAVVLGDCIYQIDVLNARHDNLKKRKRGEMADAAAEDIQRAASIHGGETIRCDEEWVFILFHQQARMTQVTARLSAADNRNERRGLNHTAAHAPSSGRKRGAKPNSSTWPKKNSTGGAERVGVVGNADRLDSKAGRSHYDSKYRVEKKKSGKEQRARSTLQSSAVDVQMSEVESDDDGFDPTPAIIKQPRQKPQSRGPRTAPSLPSYHHWSERTGGLVNKKRNSIRDGDEVSSKDSSDGDDLDDFIVPDDDEIHDESDGNKVVASDESEETEDQHSDAQSTRRTTTARLRSRPTREEREKRAYDRDLETAIRASLEDAPTGVMDDISDVSEGEGLFVSEHGGSTERKATRAESENYESNPDLMAKALAADDLQTEVYDLKAEVGGLKMDKTRLEGKYLDLKGKYQKLEESYREIKEGREDVAHWKGKHKELEAENEALKRRLLALGEDVRVF